MKQIRHRSLTRTLYWPARLPLNFSRTVAGRHPEVVDALSSIDENKLVVGESAQLRAKPLDIATLPDRLGVLIPEGADHLPIITLCVINAKRYEP